MNWAREKPKGNSLKNVTYKMDLSLELPNGCERETKTKKKKMKNFVESMDEQHTKRKQRKSAFNHL